MNFFQVWSVDDIEYRHVRNMTGRYKDLSIGVVRDNAENTVYVSYAICSKKDIFSKSTAKSLIMERFDSESFFEFHLSDLKAFLYDNRGYFLPGFTNNIIDRTLPTITINDITLNVIIDYFILEILVPSINFKLEA